MEEKKKTNGSVQNFDVLKKTLHSLTYAELKENFNTAKCHFVRREITGSNAIGNIKTYSTPPAFV